MTGRLAWEQAHRLAVGALTSLGYSEPEASAITDHLLAAEAAGITALGLRRISWIAEIIAAGAPPGDPSEVVPARGGCVLVDGHGGIGYLAADRAVAAAAESARAGGVAVAAVRDVFLTGSLRVYGDRLARQGLAGIITSSAAPAVVAPGPGGRRVLGTNPFAVFVPGHPVPLVFDTGVTSLTYSELARRAAAGEPIPAGCGLDRTGEPTTDAAAVLDGGAMLPWAGHRGFGLAVAVQALAMMAGGPAVPGGLAGCAMVIFAVDPRALDPAAPVPDLGELAGVLDRAGGRPPGLRWAQAQRAGREQGLRVEPATVTSLRELARAG
ncbi:delta(1)-pyrroline-2-carboxylate/Delta(1)-piperid eine-2-carboxylate reductase [Sphaerisporangium rufum]|uniref:Delta(1)-pyrroline-2-carboxylate/Delta(1)-piperid eine-2-carboxylate reductase n=1 Tax=Sphaerisporangium rufum TaxID=1381558 RepID=A0A919UWG6_9ACTN|nr:Ldh family oxidoreductase [Sphaerisporangium rufum]GII76001.1 delta(1)-pyrroline-2-carboxylate/Delta(1)-piperid eine-2-carboxylate reductase [Sphaerisporangium rufum]